MLQDPAWKPLRRRLHVLIASMTVLAATLELEADVVQGPRREE